jgi:hypothetical protein
MKRELPDNEYLQLLARDDAVFRDRLCDWLRANGIEPGHVPAGERPSLVGGLLTLRMFDLDAAGKRQFDPSGDQFLTRTVTIPMTVEPASVDVARWLTPPCPGCGR